MARLLNKKKTYANIEQNAAAMDLIGLGWIGLALVGLGWLGLAWVGLGWLGSWATKYTREHWNCFPAATGGLGK